MVGGRFVRTRPPHAEEQGKGGAVTWRRGVDVEGMGSGEESTFRLELATRTWVYLRGNGTPPRGRCVNPRGMARQIGWLWRASQSVGNSNWMAGRLTSGLTLGPEQKYCTL